ncbi:hypothetical protein [Streptomyces sp. NPDC048650]|uniref:hypothetical protein n=1 Tax=unclassified Streptomyces TaxID=2593676 RepID=UPI0037216CD4
MPPSPQQPQQPQFDAPQPQFGAPAPGVPAPARTGNAGLAVVAGIVVALVVAGVYGAILKATDGASIGYAGLIVGALVGATVGKLGGRNAALPVISAVLGLVAFYLGQLFGMALIFSDVAHASLGTVVFQHIDVVNTLWKEYLGPIDALFYVLAAVGGFSTTKKTAG